MQPDSGPLRSPVRLLVLAAFLCLAADFWFAWQFHYETGQLVPDFQTGELAGGGLANVSSPLARGLLLRMYLLPDMLLPTVLACLGIILFRRLAPGMRLYGYPVSPAFLKGLMLLPVLYAVADYAENIIALIYLLSDGDENSAAAAILTLLPWATRLKFVFLLISVVLLVRFALFRYWLKEPGDTP